MKNDPIFMVELVEKLSEVDSKMFVDDILVWNQHLQTENARLLAEVQKLEAEVSRLEDKVEDYYWASYGENL